MKNRYVPEVPTAIRARARQRRLYRALTSGALFLSVVLFSLYFATPISRVSKVRLRSEKAYDAEYISRIALPSREVFLPSFNKSRSVELLEANPLIARASIDVTPFSIYVDYQEIAPAFVYNGKNYLTSGELVPDHPLLPAEIYGEPSEAFLSRMPSFTFGPEVPKSEQNRSVFQDFIGADARVFNRAAAVRMKSAETYYVYFKDETEDFYYRFLIPSSRLSYFLNQPRLDYVKKVVHSDLASFKSKLKNDRINSADIKVSAWVSYVNKNRFEEE